MIILIPAYQPDVRLVRLIAGIRAAAPGWSVVVVDDGSGPAFSYIFDRARALGCDVVDQWPNRGKGRALKAGIEHIEWHYPQESVVTADCDGQHTVDDIIRVASSLDGRADTMVLGSRRFVGSVPFRSRIGNAVTRRVFSAVTGIGVSDTQTGLRAYPAALLAWLGEVPGERFEYELEVLLRSKEEGVTIEEVLIDTVYLDGNASSHFRPVSDSIRVLAPMLRFGVSSLSAFGLDFLLVMLIQAVSGNLLLSVVGARLTSSAFNYAANRHLVFKAATRTGLWRAAGRYYLLAGGLLAANYGVMVVLYERIGLGLALAKIITEIGLFLVSFRIQQRFVFGRREKTEGPAHEPFRTIEAISR